LHNPWLTLRLYVPWDTLYWQCPTATHLLLPVYIGLTKNPAGLGFQACCEAGVHGCPVRTQVLVDAMALVLLSGALRRSARFVAQGAGLCRGAGGAEAQQAALPQALAGRALSTCSAARSDSTGGADEPAPSRATVRAPLGALCVLHLGELCCDVLAPYICWSCAKCYVYFRGMILLYRSCTPCITSYAAPCYDQAHELLFSFSLPSM